MKETNSRARTVFVESLRAAMQARGLEQSDLVDRLNVTASTVSDWTNGKKYPRVDAMQRLADALGVSMSFLQTGSDLPAMPNAFPVGHLSPVRIAGTVRAGYGGVAFEDYDGVEYIDVRNPDDYIFLRVEGDSMAPHINDGDLALVRKQPEVESGQVAVVVVNGEEGTIKKVICNGESIALQPFNPAYQTRIFSGAELNDVHIAGLVVKTIRRWA